MSIHRALVGGLILVLLLVGGVLGFAAVAHISRSVIANAQARVDHDLITVAAYLEEKRELAARAFLEETRGWRIEDDNLSHRIGRARESLGLAVLNVCTARGRPIAGGYPDYDASVPLASDPILRRALEGQPHWGTMRLDERRLSFEGGSPLVTAMAVYPPEDGGEPVIEQALMWWMARPLYDDRGGVAGLVYGGVALNHNSALVDRLRELLYGAQTFEGKPVGTVTVFLGPVRVATNVLGPGQTRAVGTAVSPEVRMQVLRERRTWRDRARVVDAWYISGYQPIITPRGNVAGMLYVGLLEAPYVEARNELIERFVVTGAIVIVLIASIGYLVLLLITRPVESLSRATAQMAGGNWQVEIPASTTFREIAHLRATFAEMQAAIRERDSSLQRQNEALGQMNERLQRANRNYMDMLGFVTHELRSPISAMQSMVDTVIDGLAGDVPDAAAKILVRVRRNAEELQDMVRNYLDLSRLERGEMIANPVDVDLAEEVVQPAIERTLPLLRNRGMQPEMVEGPRVRGRVDPDLMRIVLVNYLSNAAKYGCEGGAVTVAIEERDTRVRIRVRNEGEGFAAQEKEELFGKFSRLRNQNTRGKRGSGVGLFLCRQIAELHGGEVGAESELGKWAEFFVELPVTSS